jgi:ankyrin repeat protein
VNAQSADGYTALHYAAELGHEDAIRRLMNRSANVAIEAQGVCGLVTSWQLAVDEGHDDCALLLDRTWSDDSLPSERVTPR